MTHVYACGMAKKEIEKNQIEIEIARVCNSIFETSSFAQTKLICNIKWSRRGPFNTPLHLNHE